MFKPWYYLLQPVFHGELPAAFVLQRSLSQGSERCWYWPLFCAGLLEMKLRVAWSLAWPQISKFVSIAYDLAFSRCKSVLVLPSCTSSAWSIYIHKSALHIFLKIHPIGMNVLQYFIVVRCIVCAWVVTIVHTVHVFWSYKFLYFRLSRRIFLKGFNYELSIALWLPLHASLFSSYEPHILSFDMPLPNIPVAKVWNLGWRLFMIIGSLSSSSSDALLLPDLILHGYIGSLWEPFCRMIKR